MALSQAPRRNRQALPLPRFRRLPLSPDRSLHGLARTARARRGSSGALPVLLRGLRRHAGGSARIRSGPRFSWSETPSSARCSRRCSSTSSWSSRGSRRPGCADCRFSTCRRRRTSSGHVALLGADRPAEILAGLERLTELWHAYFAIYGAAVLVRASAVLLRRRRERRRVGEAGAVDRTRGRRSDSRPFLLLSVLPRAFGLASPLLSTCRRRLARLHPARLRVRDPEVAALGRRDLRARGARDDRVGRARRHDVRAPEHASRPDVRRDGRGRQERRRVRLGPRPRLASRADEEADHGRPREDPVPRHLPVAAGAARHRAGLRDPAQPRRSSSAAIVQRVEDGLHVVPCSLFLFEEAGLAASRAGASRRAPRREDVWRLRGAAFGEAEAPGLARSARGGLPRASSRCAAPASLVGALGVGHKDGRVPLSSRGRGPADGGHGPGGPRLRERAALRRARRASRGDPNPAAVPGERHPLLLLRHPRARPRGPRPLGQPRLRRDGAAAPRRSSRASPFARGAAGAGARPPVRRRAPSRPSRARCDERRRATSGTCASRFPRSRETRTAGRARGRRDRPGARGAGARRARAPGLARRARGRRRARGQHADRRPLLLRAAPARGHGARPIRATRS